MIHSPQPKRVCHIVLEEGQFAHTFPLGKISKGKMLFLDFQSELKALGKYTFEGSIGQKYQDFVDYWNYVAERLGDKVPRSSSVNSSHSLVQEFHDEQLLNGKYTLDGPIGKEYQEFIEFWQKVAENLGKEY